MRKILGVVLALTFTNGVQAADDPADIVARAIKAHGGKEKLAKRQAHQWKARGVMHMGEVKLPYTITYAFQHPDQFRFDMAGEFMGQKVEITAATDGKQGWEKSGDMLRDMPKEKFVEFRHSIHVIHLSQVLPLTDKTYTLTPAGETKVNEKAAVGVTVTAKGRRDVTLYFDKETGLLVKTQTRILDEFSNKEVTQETFALDYKEKDGQKAAHKLLINRQGKTFIEEEFSDLKSSEKLDPKFFAKP